MGQADKKPENDGDIKTAEGDLSEQTSENVPKKRGRPAKASSEKTASKKAPTKSTKATESEQAGKRPRGRPPGIVG